MQRSDNDSSWNLGWRGGDEGMRKVRDSENPQGAMDGRVGGVEGYWTQGES